MLGFKEDEIYWPGENESLTIGHTTVRHRGVEVKGDSTRITLDIERFKQVNTKPLNDLIFAGVNIKQKFLCSTFYSLNRSVVH